MILVLSYLLTFPGVHVSMQAIRAKANKLLGLLIRPCPFLRETRVRRALYLAMVKSPLCYASEIWSPHINAHKLQLESVQRRATRWIMLVRKRELNYKDRHLKLNLLPLSYSREINDLVYFYKAL